MIARKVSADNFDKKESTINPKTPNNHIPFSFLVYLMALHKARRAKRKHRISSLDFTLFTTSEWMGCTTNSTVMVNGNNQCEFLKRECNILKISRQERI